MWSMAVVVVDPWFEAANSFLGVLIEACIGSPADSGLDESFGFSVSSWSVDFCALVFDSEPCAFGLEQVGDEARPVVDHDAAQGDFMSSEVFRCLAKKKTCRDGLFIRPDELHAQYRAERGHFSCDHIDCTAKSISSIRPGRIHAFAQYNAAVAELTTRLSRTGFDLHSAQQAALAKIYDALNAPAQPLS
jgi:hypothetical protein